VDAAADPTLGPHHHLLRQARPLAAMEGLNIGRSRQPSAVAPSHECRAGAYGMQIRQAYVREVKTLPGAACKIENPQRRSKFSLSNIVHTFVLRPDEY